MSTHSRCIILAVITPKPGHKDDVIKVLSEVIPDVHKEPGCELYAMHEDTDGRIVFVEAWTTRELWQQHMEFDTVARIRSGLEGLLEVPVELIEAYGVPVGGAKGVLST